MVGVLSVGPLTPPRPTASLYGPHRCLCVAVTGGNLTQLPVEALFPDLFPPDDGTA